MASKPFFDPRRGDWHMKYRPSPFGPWVRVKLGKHPTPYPASKPPRKPPRKIEERAAEFAEIEWRAKHRLPSRQGSDPLAAYADAYLAGFELLHRHNTARHAAKTIERFVEFATDNRVTAVQMVSRALCRKYLESRAVSGISQATLKSECGYLSPLFSRAVDEEVIASNPWARIRVPGKSAKHAPTFWSNDEIRAIVVAAPEQWMKDLILFLANTGIRISAALQARWDWIDYGRRVIAVPAPHDKAGRGYQAVLTIFLADMLNRMRSRTPGPYLFPNRWGRPRAYAFTGRLFARAVSRAGVPPGTPHDLRHTFGRLLMNDAPAHAVMAALGHSSLAMTQEYTRIDGERASERVQEFAVGG
jgi:integrase